MKDRENDGSLGNRIFVGGLSWDVTERQFEDAFDRYGKISECQIMIEKDTGRPRGFGFITFTDRRGADDAIKHMHGKVLGDKIISVNKAEPKVSGDDVDHFHKGGGYSSRGRGAPAAEDECFKCGRPGHWAQECPSTGGDRGRFRDPVPMRSTIGEFNGHKDRYGDRELERERGCYIDERRDGGRYNDRDKYGTRDFYQVESKSCCTMKDRENDGSLDNRIFVGGLSWDVTERQLEDAFDCYGKISECQIMIEKDTGRPRGFGFITFTDRRGADDAIKHMHGKELGDKVISVNKAEPKVGGDDVDHFHKGGRYSSRGRGAPAAEDECFKCGRPGHWARECPSTGGDRGRFRDPVPMRSRIGELNGHRDRYGDRGLEQERGHYMDERRDGGRYNDRDKYETRDFYPVERYDAPAYRDRLVSDDRYGMPDHRHLEDDYGERERSYDRDRYGRGRASDRYGAIEGRREYRSRPGPYDRPSRSGGRPSSQHRW